MGRVNWSAEDGGILAKGHADSPFHAEPWGERWRNEEAIATGFVESAVNQMVSKRFAKRQQMQWTKRGAHLLLQTLTWVLANRLEETFQKWYPGFHRAEAGTKEKAA